MLTCAHTHTRRQSFCSIVRQTPSITSVPWLIIPSFSLFEFTMKLVWLNAWLPDHITNRMLMFQLYHSSPYIHIPSIELIISDCAILRLFAFVQSFLILQSFDFILSCWLPPSLIDWLLKHEKPWILLNYINIWIIIFWRIEALKFLWLAVRAWWMWMNTAESTNQSIR